RLWPQTAPRPPTIADAIRSVSTSLTVSPMFILRWALVVMAFLLLLRPGARPVPSAARARDEAREEIPARGVAEAREPLRRLDRGRFVVARQRRREVVQGRPALAGEQIAEQRRADRVGESRRRRSHRVRRVAPARGVARTRARQQRAREERPADEVVARRRHSGAKAEQRRR